MANFRVIWEGAILTFSENETQTLQKGFDLQADLLALMGDLASNAVLSGILGAAANYIQVNRAIIALADQGNGFDLHIPWPAIVAGQWWLMWPTGVIPNATAVDSSAGAVAAWGPNRLDVFSIGMDRAMYHGSWDGSSWNLWEALGGGFTSPPAVTSWGPNRLDIVGLGMDSAMYHGSWDGNSWNVW